MTYTLVGRLVGEEGVVRGRVVVEGERIKAAGLGVPPEGRVVELEEGLILPGFLDLHTHGGGGYALHTEEPEEILAYARYLPRTGTTAFLITVVGVAGGLPEAQIRAATRALEAQREGAEALGLHLEGPYLNPHKRGAHRPEWLRLPDLGEGERLLALSRGWLRTLTLAPELPGAEALIHRLVQAGVVVSLGHTEAGYEEARRAFQLGARHLTHAFNAMPPLGHRAPGPLGALLEAQEATAELIGDGIHVHPAAMLFLIRALGPGRVALVTDAQPGAGLGEGATFSFGGQKARVEGGVARLEDGTLAGSVATMDGILRLLVRRLGLGLGEAVAMLSRVPARVAGVGGRKGRIAPGYDADLVVLDENLEVQATLTRGRVAFAQPGLRPSLEGLPSWS